ncbi:hypothetical protein Tco_1030372 [Tanacetum coccineum]|uniref:Integrase catalytic domain-containing protein n=1 Tax=Tanacetum coccineum TaxID=301880 RepID=A0ABQ5G613_9ASTR
MEIFSRLYINEIVAGHGVPVSIISDRDRLFKVVERLGLGAYPLRLHHTTCGHLDISSVKLEEMPGRRQEAEKEWDSYCKSSLESPTRTKTYLRTRRRDEAKVSATVRERYGLGRATEISG